MIIEKTRAGLVDARAQSRVGGHRRIMAPEVIARGKRILDRGETRQQVAEVIGVGVKTIYKYFPVNEGDHRPEGQP